MRYLKTVRLKDGRECRIRSGEERDTQAMLDNFVLTHAQTDFLCTYPDETVRTAADKGQRLQNRLDDPGEVELLAEVDGIVTSTAGVGRIGTREKLRHRAELGISLDAAWWGLGIGRALLEACIECARSAGYAQLELEVVADNVRALSLYRSAGFVEYGRNPKGFRSRLSGWQELVLMRLEL